MKDNPQFGCISACQCYGHSDQCIYDERVDLEGRSIDIHGNYDGGGVCQNCRVSGKVITLCNFFNV